VILPETVSYGAKRKPWNLAVNPNPLLIIQCDNEDDIVRAISYAREKNLPISVRSGGIVMRASVPVIKRY
jgi:FAD/FMN-containing dehydrogenase